MTGLRMAAICATAAVLGVLAGATVGLVRELAMEAAQYDLDQDPGGA